MRINRLQLKNFKRFTDLTIDLSSLQPSPKLVLMIGANGSGKSSVFDAFEWMTLTKSSPENKSAYYQKLVEQMVSGEILFDDGSKVHRANDKAEVSGALPYSLFYGRSAFRHVPELTRTAIGGRESVVSKDEDRPLRYIQLDQRFENDIDILAERVVREIFIDQAFKADELRERYVLPINRALNRVFNAEPETAVSLQSIIPPLQGKPLQLNFRKGQVEIHYDLLSSGEKEIINILLNLFIRRDSYPDTIYFIDELDVHLNTSLQFNLIKEVTENWVPDNCQLWTASHSLGFIQYAKESDQAAIIDFDQFDFDQSHTLSPIPKESLAVYEIAVPKETILEIFRDKTLVLCENKNDEYYNLLKLPGKLFIGVHNKDEVYRSVKNDSRFYGVIDRDYLTENEIKKIRNRFPKLFVLGFYAFENYLYHPDNISEVAPGFDVASYRDEILRQKKARYKSILVNLKQSRNYRVLKDENIEDKELDELTNALESDDFETFYPLFDMKRQFDRSSLAKLNLAPARLARTKWFSQAISRAFNQEEEKS
ncbi:MAG: AAA family ATPase [Acidobacteriota bacterium]|nr:AAA family ATPase [Acidobacteriota bacterium]